MRLTNKVCAQHLGWTFKKHWLLQRKRLPRDTGAAAEVIKNGVSVQNVQDVSKSDKYINRERKYIGDHSNPLRNTKPCHLFADNNVLLKGIQQALLLTKTIEVQCLPKIIQNSIDKIQITGLLERNVKAAILASNIYSADQDKLNKKKNNLRPDYNLPREYGITNGRRTAALINKLLTECEKIAGRKISSQLRIIDQVNYNVTLPSNDDLILFRINAQKLITSNQPLPSIHDSVVSELPYLYPLKCTISMPKEQIYSHEIICPFTHNLNTHPHTIFLNFDKDKVANFHDVPVSISQFQSRNMLKAFAVAAARAHQLYGKSACDKLPRPIVVQSIQTDGRMFHFGVFQLNDLRIDDLKGPKNYWFHSSNIDLFEKCEYVSGRPKLKGFNKDVLRYMYAFYINS